MISLLLPIILSAPCVLPAPVPEFVLQAKDDSEIDAKITAAGKDIAKLLELAGTCATAGKDDAAKRVYRKIIEIDASNEAAHKALNHQLYDKKWFESFAELAKYKREEAAKMKSKGLARYKDEWVLEADVPFLSMGWTKDTKGAWCNPADIAREKQAAEWKAAGFQFRADDNSWIAPDDIDKWHPGSWKCGGEWVDQAKADEYHAKLGQWWELVGEHFVVASTCDWEGGNLARWHADQAYPELVRIFGVEPKQKPRFIVLNSLEQYNRAAGGTPPIIPEVEGYSSLHGAYFADNYFDFDAKPAQFLGAGVTYWDRKDAKVGEWGPFWSRWAAAQSFIDAIDPSWAAVGDRIASQAADETSAAFWSEKKIPRWLRYGAASYVERFMKNPAPLVGVDPGKMRVDSFAEIKKAGGLHKLEDIFKFALDIKDVPGSGRLYQEAGLVVAYMLDGAAANKELAKKHEAFKKALASGSKADAVAAAAALHAELVKCERDIKKFAGLASG
jgi:hypothetical protein